MTEKYIVIDVNHLKSKITEYNTIIEETKLLNYEQASIDVIVEVYSTMIREFQKILDNSSNLSSHIEEAWNDGCDTAITHSFSDSTEIMNMCINSDKEEYLKTFKVS